MKSTAESQHPRSSNERNKSAPQVKCSWKRNKPEVMSTQRIPSSCIVAVKIILLEPAVVKPVHTCRCIIPFFFFLSFTFCSTCKLFICFYSTTPTPSSPGFMRMKWAQVLSSTFFFCFAFHRFSPPPPPQKKELAIVSLMMFVFRCVQKLASKIASFFFFAPKLLSLGARLRLNDTDTALYTQTASPSLAWTLTSINNNNSSLFSQVFPQCDSLVSTTHSLDEPEQQGKKKEDKKWWRCRSHSSTKLRWRLIRNHNILPPGNRMLPKNLTGERKK